MGRDRRIRGHFTTLGLRAGCWIASPTNSALTDNLPYGENGEPPDVSGLVWTFDIIKERLSIDANFDAEINESDEPIKKIWGGVLDLTRSGITNREPIAINFEPAGLESGTLTLEAVAGGSKIKVWSSVTEGEEVALPVTWTLGTDTIPSTLYIEGKELSGSSPRDITLRLTYAASGQACQDEIALTVVTNSLTIFVDEAVAGEREAWQFPPLKYGHSFMRWNSSHTEVYQPLSAYVNDYEGWYPSGTVDPIHSVVDGYIAGSDTSHLAEHQVDHTWDLGAKKFFAGLRYVRTLSCSNAKFDLYNFNCTDVAIGAGAAAGVQVPAKIHKSTSFTGHCPGELGEDLREMHN